MKQFIKVVIMVVAIALLVLVFALNVVYLTNVVDNIKEEIRIERYGLLNLALTLIIAIGIILICKKLNTIAISRQVKIAIVIGLIIIYMTAQICWIDIRDATPITDQLEIYQLSKTIYENNIHKIKSLQYFELYPQQLTLVFVYSNVFNIFNTTDVKLLQYGNVIANALTMIAIILIVNRLQKQYKVNMVKTLILAFTFVTLPLLSTFVYGDIVSIPMCLFAVYFIMKYGMENKTRYAILSSLFMAIAYILKMNSLIYIIAITIYLVLNLLQIQEKNVKHIVKKLVILIIFIIISIMPATMIKSMMQDKLGLDKDKAFPPTGFILMGMQETFRGNGWYNDEITYLSRKNLELSKELYKTGIVKRIKYFWQNPIYTINFYINKTTSMWTENTYEAIWHNQSFNFMYRTKTHEDLDEQLKNVRIGINIYQKALVLIIFGSCILVIYKHNKNLSNELLLLITIFIGGFLFHTLWEAKARYIISYILVLIPVASIIIAEQVNKEEIDEQEG